MKDKRLILHIGSPKTGTTSIQGFLKLNHDALLDVGVNYVSAGRSNIAHNSMMRAIKTGQAAEVFQAIAEEIQASPSTVHIVSSEMFFRPGIARVLASGLPDALRQNTQVVAYIRRQDKYLEAMYKQIVKNGRIAPDAMAFHAARIETLAYSNVLSTYAEAFDGLPMRVRPFQRSLFKGGDVIEDFLDLIGAEMSDKFEKPDPGTNKTLSTPVSEMLGMLKQNSEINTRELIREIIRQNASGAICSNDVYDKATRRDIMAYHKEDNEAVRQTYCPEASELFDLSDLETDDDPYPSAEAQVENWKSAATAVVQGMSGLSVL